MALRLAFAGFLVALCAQLSGARGEVYAIVESNRVECFIEDLSDRELVHGSFQVEEGGDLDIDFFVYNAAEKRVYSAERANEEHFRFESTRSGVHKFCFENRDVSRGKKKIVFAIHRGHGELLAEEVATRDHLKPIEDMVMTLSDKIRTSERESYPNRARGTKNDKSTSRACVSTIVEGVVLIGLNLWQVYY